MYLQCIFVYLFPILLLRYICQSQIKGMGYMFENKRNVKTCFFVVIGEIIFCCCFGLLKYTMFLKLDMQVVNMKII